MQTIKIKLHSTVDIITNSSTVIYTYQDGSLAPVKELIDEMLKISGSELKADDCFYFGVFLDDTYEYLEDNSEAPELSKEEFSALKLSMLKGEIEKPKWMINVEDSENWNCYQKSTALEILPKDEKYSELANKLLNYLNSTSHEACQDG